MPRGKRKKESVTEELRNKRLEMLVELLKEERTYNELSLETGAPIDTIRKYMAYYIKPNYVVEIINGEVTRQQKLKILGSKELELYEGLPKDVSMRELKKWALNTQGFCNMDIPKIVKNVKRRGHMVHKIYNGRKVYQ